MSVNIGILGFAHGHVNMYCDAWKKDPGLGVVAAAGWDHDADRLSGACEKFGCQPAASAEELLERDDIDAVVIAAETAKHADLVELAAAAGKAIVLQKPLALTMAEADRIVNAVAKAGIAFTMAWQMRGDAQNLKIKELLDEGALGRVFMVRRRHGLSVCLNETFATSWHMDPEMNRDIWADDAAHPFDFIYWLLGAPESVTAEIVSLHDARMPSDNGIAIFRYPEGPLAEVTCSFTNTAAENTTEIICEKGSIIQNYGDVPSCNVPKPEDACGLKWYEAEKGEWTYSDLPVPGGHGERIAGLSGPLAEFLQGGRGPLATAEEGRAVLKMILATYVSTQNGQRIKLDDTRINEM